MTNLLVAVIAHSKTTIKIKLIGIYALLLALNVGTWLWAFVAFHDFPILIGTCLLAYGFGLRHAVDADHIAAIDNVTRKLMQENQRPVAVGFYFSVGHSSLVMLATSAIAFASIAMQKHLNQFREVGGVVGTVISSVFLFAIAIANLFVFFAIYKAWKNLRNGGAYSDNDFDLLLNSRGFLLRIMRPLFRLISKSWHMFFLGVLFGLGFDTATEIGLLGLSATEVANGMSPWTILVFPALFGAGMSLVDTLDGHLMLGAYGWACIKPMRRIYYNMIITMVSIVVAVAVGSIEAIGLLVEKLKLKGWVWDLITSINDNFDVLGYAIIGIFILSWVLSLLVYRYKRFDKTGLAFKN